MIENSVCSFCSEIFVHFHIINRIWKFSSYIFLDKIEPAVPLWWASCCFYTSWRLLQGAKSSRVWCWWIIVTDDAGWPAPTVYILDSKLLASVLVQWIPSCRALAENTFSPEVQQIIKIRTDQKPDFFLNGQWTFQNRKKSKKFRKKGKNNHNFQKIIFQDLLLTPGTLWEFIFHTWQVKCLKYKSGFSLVRQDLSGKFRCPVLSSQETHMPSPVEPYLPGFSGQKSIVQCMLSCSKGQWNILMQLSKAYNRY